MASVRQSFTNSLKMWIHINWMRQRNSNLREAAFLQDFWILVTDGAKLVIDSKADVQKFILDTKNP